MASNPTPKDEASQLGGFSLPPGAAEHYAKDEARPDWYPPDPERDAEDLAMADAFAGGPTIRALEADLASTRQALQEAREALEETERRLHQSGGIVWAGDDYKERQFDADFDAFWKCWDDEDGAECLLCVVRKALGTQPGMTHPSPSEPSATDG